MEHSSAFEEIQALERRERGHVAAGNPPRVFYHPGRSANGTLDGSQFEPHMVPPGFYLDLDAWEENGRSGAAPIREILIEVEEIEVVEVEVEVEVEVDPFDAEDDESEPETQGVSLEITVGHPAVSDVSDDAAEEANPDLTPVPMDERRTLQRKG